MKLEADAWEIRVRAERKVGELMHEGKHDRSPQGGDRQKVLEKPFAPKPTLAEIGIDKGLAHRARKVWKLTAKEFALFVMDGRADVQHAVERSLN
jgi:hypothetical protein